MTLKEYDRYIREVLQARYPETNYGVGNASKKSYSNGCRSLPDRPHKQKPEEEVSLSQMDNPPSPPQPYQIQLPIYRPVNGFVRSYNGNPCD